MAAIEYCPYCVDQKLVVTVKVVDERVVTGAKCPLCGVER